MSLALVSGRPYRSKMSESGLAKNINANNKKPYSKLNLRYNQSLPFDSYMLPVISCDRCKPVFQTWQISKSVRSDEQKTDPNSPSNEHCALWLKHPSKANLKRRVFKTQRKILQSMDSLFITQTKVPTPRAHFEFKIWVSTLRLLRCMKIRSWAESESNAHDYRHVFRGSQNVYKSPCERQRRKTRYIWGFRPQNLTIARERNMART